MSDDAPRKFFKCTFTVTVICEDEPIAPDTSLGDIEYEIMEGECVGDVEYAEVQEITYEEAKVECEKIGAEIEFFGP